VPKTLPPPDSATLGKPERPWALRLLPPFPAVANRILSLVQSEDVASAKISEIIRLDPTFTAEILRIANSALFGVSREITNVTTAVNLLGLERMKSMATLVAINSMVKGALKVELLRRSWVHSLVTALVTEEISRLARVERESAYTAGLLHNLGSLGLMAAYPESYARLLEVSGEFGFDLLQTERDLFEIDHCAAGAYLAQEWNFPDEIAAVLATHHEEPAAGELTLYSLVQLGWRMADTLGYASILAGPPWAYETLLERIPNPGNSWLCQGVDEAKSQIDERLASFQI